MSIEELKAEQEAASKLKREGGDAVREFRKVAIRHILELVGSPAGIRLRWVIDVLDHCRQHYFRNIPNKAAMVVNAQQNAFSGRLAPHAEASRHWPSNRSPLYIP